MTDTTVIQRSVTRGDAEESPRSGGGLLGGAGSFFYFLSPYRSRAKELPIYWSSERDKVLRGTLHMESMWAAAIYKAVTKRVALGWSIEDSDDSEIRVRRYQNLFLTADAGAGWVSFGSRHLLDFTTTDNGAFSEIVRATGAPGSRILGLMHLDSMRCIRTGDPEIPVLYTDRRGRQHELKAHQVIMLADMPNASETYNGVGFCAASRAYPTISKLAAIEQLLHDKVTGSRPTAVQILQGLSTKQLEEGLASANAGATAKGNTYQGVAVMGVMHDQPFNLVTIPIAEIPDGFDAETERKNAYLIYANCIGVPVQDIQPLSGQGLGTGTQTVILDEAAEGQGLAAWVKAWEHATNQNILPDTTTFHFASNDLRDKKTEAEVKTMVGGYLETLVKGGIITGQQALQVLIEESYLPRDFQTASDLAGGSLADDEKPVETEPEAPSDTRTNEPIAEPIAA